MFVCEDYSQMVHIRYSWKVGGDFNLALWQISAKYKHIRVPRPIYSHAHFAKFKSANNSIFEGNPPNLIPGKFSGHKTYNVHTSNSTQYVCIYMYVPILQKGCGGWTGHTGLLGAILISGMLARVLGNLLCHEVHERTCRISSRWSLSLLHVHVHTHSDIIYMYFCGAPTLYICMHVCLHVHVHLLVHVCMYTGMSMYMYTTHMHIHIYMYTYMYIHAHTCIHAQTHTLFADYTASNWGRRHSPSEPLLQSSKRSELW